MSFEWEGSCTQCGRHVFLDLPDDWEPKAMYPKCGMCRARESEIPHADLPISPQYTQMLNDYGKGKL